MLQKDEFISNLIEECGTWFQSEDRLNAGKMTMELYPYDHLFSPIQVNGDKIRNRLCMAPMGNLVMCDQKGRPNAKMIEYFAARAKGGVGLITSGLVHVSHKWDPSLFERDGVSYFPRIDTYHSNLMGWRDLVDQVHAYGARFFIQLSAGMGRVGSPESLISAHKFPVSASWNPNFYVSQIPCAPLRDRQLKGIISNFGQIAATAKSNKVDGVYLHGHEGYLLEQLTNPAFNRRSGGPFANYQTFGIETVKKIRRRVGPSFPIMYRIDLSLALNEAYGDRMNHVKALKKFRNGRTVAMTLDYMTNLVQAGVDMFDVDVGCYETWWLPHPPNAMPPGVFLPVARLVKDCFLQNNIKSNAGLEVPIVAVGKLGNPDLAERALREGTCDMVMLGRPLLADPEWPNKAYAGRVAEICPCIGDQDGCLNELAEGGHIQCTVNPRTGLEDVIPEDLPPATSPLKIGVVGAGPAGVMCAITAAKRGHNVVLFDKNSQVGGMIIAGSRPKMKFDLANYLAYLTTIVARAADQSNLEVHLSTKVTPDLLTEYQFDTLVCATGSRPKSLPIEGIDLPHVFQATDFLHDPAVASNAASPIVIGGGSTGLEVAHMLAYEMGKTVTVVEMLPLFMKGTSNANRNYMLYYLERAGVHLLNCTRVTRIEVDHVVVKQNVSPTVPNPYVTWKVLLPDYVINPLERRLQVKEQEKHLPCDLVVIATGVQSDDSLYDACLKTQIAPKVYNIGDSFAVGRIFEATKGGFALGRSL